MTTVGTGQYTYEMIENWGNLPQGWTFGDVSAVAVDSQDRVYVFHRKDPPIIVFDREGNFISSWGNGSINFAHGLHIGPDDVIYLTDRDDHVALKFTLDGRVLMILGTRGQPSDTGCTEDSGTVLRAAEPFNKPAGMVRSPSGDLYVADGYRNSRVHRFSANGDLISSWGNPGKTAPNEFHVPHCLWVNRQGVGLRMRPGQQPHPGLLGDGGLYGPMDPDVSPNLHIHGCQRDSLYQRACASGERMGQAGEPPGSLAIARGPLDLRGLPGRPVPGGAGHAARHQVCEAELASHAGISWWTEPRLLSPVEGGWRT